MSFQSRQVLPGVYHIQDAMGVCMTLLCGAERALLVDTGYGLENVAAYVGALTDKPLDVLLTHGHHDHALGARWFPGVQLLPADFPVYQTYTGDAWRRHVLKGAREKGLAADEGAFLSALLPPPRPLRAGSVSLGGLTAQVIPCPGHTPGSAVVLVPERRLLLTGDDWNPCTWLFFPEALSAQAYRRNVRRLLDLDAENLLCSHQFSLYPRAYLERFLDELTDERLSMAPQVDTGAFVGARTAQAALPMGQVFVFDRDKFSKDKEA